MDVYEAAKILGVQKASDFRAVQTAYKKAAIKFHPDKSKEKNAEAKFKRISDAYNELVNYKKSGGKFPLPKKAKSQKRKANSEPSWSPPSQPTQTHPNSSANQSIYNTTSQNYASYHFRRVSAPPPPQSTQSTPPSKTTEAGLAVHGSFYRKMNDYFRQIFGDDQQQGLYEQQLKADFGDHVTLDDVKQILANHAKGQSPLHIEYTPYGRKLTWGQRQSEPTTYQQYMQSRYSQPNASISTGLRHDPRQQSVPTQPQQQALEVSTQLVVNPLSYSHYYSQIMAGSGTASMYGLLRSPTSQMEGYFQPFAYNGMMFVDPSTPVQLMFDHSVPVSS